MAETCCVKGSDIMILSCSGSSNVGQLSNQAAVPVADGPISWMGSNLINLRLLNRFGNFKF